MGLDIYLYTAAQAAQNDAYDKASAALYADGPDGKSPRDGMTDDEYKEWSAEHSYTPYEDVPSHAHPDHLFNRRYLRSSYNSGGFNHAVPEMLGSSGVDDAKYPNERGSIYWIFEPMGREWDGDEGTVGADDVVRLRACRVRALEVADALRSCDRLRVVTVGPNMFSPPPMHTDNDALAMYRQHAAEREIKPDDWYLSGPDLEIFGDGLKILAAIPGKATFNVPGVHLIYRQQDDGIDSYIQSAEIVAEFCDEAIDLIERDGSCRISWSG